MPGILPMKVIKVGSTAQSRIAQACDRCRSKKIRCDGIRPCCTQCANVGFECKTSDKLSRRAFPRGYTESLEEKVRSLEAEVRDLKDLLDEKDEKIDMLSKIHSNRRPSTSVARSPSFVPSPKLEITASSSKEDVFKIQASPLLFGADNSDSYFMGASSGRAFVDALKRKIQENGKSLAGLNMDVFLNNQSPATTPSQEHSPKSLSAPPRLFSDKCVNVFFQEWAPLFPVLHKPTFLPLYEEYMSDPAQVTNPHKVAQLHLVFGIAGLSSDVPDRDEIANCESQWRPALETILMENTLLTLQCLVLALIHCISNGDYTRLQHYKGIAVGLSHRLGLHQSQKRFSFGALTTETRKKVFWTLYTVDCFSAAVLGLPKLLKEEDIHAEYPSDTDDEYVTEKGFQPTLPGECTRISSALALFRAARILSKVLEQNYPAAATHELSLQSLNSLEHELNDWSDKLPQHLKLTFVQDKPSTNITGSRSALLSLAFYYIKSLIHRPAVGSSLGNKSSPSVITLASSSKHMIQIVQLLEERGLSFSMCLNKSEMLTLCGLSLLYQGLDLKQEGKLMQEGQRLIAVVIKYLEKAHAPGAADFKKLAGSMSSLAAEPKYVGHSPVPKSSASSRNQTSSQIYQDPSTNSTDTGLAQNQSPRRATVPSVPKYKGSRLKETSRLESPLSGMDALNPPRSQSMSQPQTSKRSKLPNLDYLSLSSTPISSQPQSPTQQAARLPIQPPRNHMYSPAVSNSKPSTGTVSEWEVLVGSFDDRSIYDAIYGGGPTPALSITDTTASSLGASWSPDSWDYTTTILGDSLSSSAPPPQSVLSFSEESLSSGDEFPANELAEPALLFNNVPQDYNKHATQTPPDMLTDWGQASFDLNSVFGP